MSVGVFRVVAAHTAAGPNNRCCHSEDVVPVIVSGDKPPLPQKKAPLKHSSAGVTPHHVIAHQTALVLGQLCDASRFCSQGRQNRCLWEPLRFAQSARPFSMGNVDLGELLI